MNYKFGLLALISSIVMGFGYTSKADFRPPGTVEFVDNFFYDVRELCNSDWQEYLSYLKVNEGIDSDAYANALPDTMVWQGEEGNMFPYVQQYFQHPSYGSYPVVGVSQKQAMDYCTWRTEAVKIMLEANKQEGPLDFYYRLPSKTEWELMANAGYDEKARRQYEKHLNANKQIVYNIPGAFTVNMKFKGQAEEYNQLNPAPST